MTLTSGVSVRWVLGALLLGGLSGCVSQAPIVDGQFGAAVVAARAQQTLNPDAAQRPVGVSGLDGRSAKLGLDRYHDTFKAPPPSANVFNIGVGADTGGGR